jgi:predicted dehydrogenase
MNTSQEKLRVAVAGTSFGGHVQIPVFQSTARTRVVAVASGRAERARQAAAEHGIPAHYTNFEEMLDKEKPDIVSITTPPALHFPMTMAALSRGIHILCEKPFAMNVEEARQMKAAADHTPVVAMIDFEFRFVSARAYVKDLLRDNYLGEVRMADFLVHLGLRSEAQDRPFDWWSDESQAGGLLGAFGSHAVDMLRMFLGEPRRILADLTTFVKEREGRQVTSDDAYTLLLDFKSGARAVVQMTLAAGVDDVHAGIYGNLGQLVIPHIFGTELLGGKRSDKKTGPMTIPAQYCYPADEAQPLRGPFRVLLGRMIEAIDKGAPSPSPNFEDALNSQILLDAAHLSVKRGTWIEI